MDRSRQADMTSPAPDDGSWRHRLATGLSRQAHPTED